MNFPVVSGGFALLAATGVTGSLVGGLTPVLGGLGLVGVAGAAGMTVMSMEQCGGPFMCVAPTGQCCFLALTFRGTLCPQSC